MSTTTPNWTPAQKAAIEHVDGALLVSAAAGSGKTAVLAERCAYLVCDAPEPCEVDELLVLTFTRAAAAEMRERIDRTLRRKIAEHPEPGERLLRQLRLIDRAAITTLDAFCGSLVRTHFHQVGVDPAFSMLAPEDASLLRDEVGTRLLDAEYDGPQAKAFKQLLDGYFGSDDARLLKSIIQGHNLIQSIVDPDVWMTQAIARLRPGGGGDSDILKAFTGLQQRAIASAQRACASTITRAEKFEGLSNYVKHLRELEVELQFRAVAADRGDFDALAAMTDAFKAPRLPTIKNDVPGKPQIQEAINRIKKQLSGEIAQLGRWTRGQLLDDLARIAPLADYFFDLVRRFGKAYDVEKRNRRALDFADAQTLTLRILRGEGEPFRPSQTAIDLQTRYRHVLVDEYQDINPLQNAILRLASRDRGAEVGDPPTRSNLFSVGDVKQSIYRFRLAEPQQFIDRQELLRGATADGLGRAIDLQENFRSRAPLLEAVNDIFALLMTKGAADIEYDQTHALRSLGGYPAVGEPQFVGKPIELHLLPREPEPQRGEAGDSAGDDEEVLNTFEREAALIVRRIRELVSADESKRKRIAIRSVDGGPTDRPISYGDIAILLRSAKFKSSQVADMLRAAGIPVRSDDATGFFKATEVQDILSVLRVLSNAQQDVPLAGVIRSPLCEIADKEDALASIRIAFPDEPFHRATLRYAIERSDPLAGLLKSMFARIDAWRRMFQERSVAEGLLAVYAHNNYLTFNRALPDGEQRLANLRELLSRAETFGTFERQGLDRFLAFLGELEKNDELGRPSVERDSADVVQVMTVHKSKGLEFPVVIVPDLGKRFNEQSLSDPVLLDRKLGIGLAAVDMTRRVRYPTAASTVIRDHVRRQALAEEIRVLYVALTRAREHLILISSAAADCAEEWRQDWADHRGPLPDDVILSAKTTMDWIGPIVAMTERQGLGTFELLDQTKVTDAPAAVVSETPRAATRDAWLQSSKTNKITEPDAALVVRRIEYQYLHQAATTQKATQRVTDLVLPEPAPASIGTPQRASALDWPRVYRANASPTALEIGAGTHRLLQFLDFARPLTALDVAAQIASLVGRRLMSEADAGLVDAEAVVWLATTDLVEQIRQPGARLLREQPVALAQRLKKGTADDLVLLRGRADAMLVAPSGITLIDYKNDRVDAGRLTARIEHYAPQIRGYAEAIGQIAGRPVARAALVFLRARQIADVPLITGPAA